ncbi:SENP1 [Lepeophtheirus salmonis]|uniref:SENP1 n=1 Tax=Lepeophtheirus salmonis TaxID=72036 RepID=A0A7R8D406_LEPSM|nr:SENP1 [Lepeophtheirus salmonis]CAF2988362.1 SENP1 [Lepeophtheirus salmonis]
MFSSRKRYHSDSEPCSDSTSESHNKRVRQSEPEGYLEFCWRKICCLFGYNNLSNLGDEEKKSPSHMGSRRHETQHSGDESETDNDDPVIVASTIPSSRGSVEIIKEMKSHRSDAFQHREAFSLLYDPDLPTQSSSPHERSYSVHQNVFHPKLGKNRRSSILRNFVSPVRPNKSNGIYASIRLEEKDRYRKLISDYGTQSLKDLVNYGFSPIPKSKASPLVVDLMKSYDEDELPVVVAESTPIVRPHIRSKDNDVCDIIERYSYKINSLDIELSKSPSYSDDFLRNLLDKYSTRSPLKVWKIVSGKHLSITDIAIELPEKEKEEVKLPEITDEMMTVIKKSFSSNKMLIDEYKITITRKDIETLKGLNWLNDEIINFYMQMIVNRSEKAENKFPKVYAFNTFFYPKLMAGGHQVLRRWTRKVDIFSYDIILVPVHLGVHWCLATIDFRKPGVFYYDSMGGNNSACLDALTKYLEDEHLDKKKSGFDTSEFKNLIVKDMPQQMNGSDCEGHALFPREDGLRNS